MSNIAKAENYNNTNFKTGLNDLPVFLVLNLLLFYYYQVKVATRILKIYNLFIYSKILLQYVYKLYFYSFYRNIIFAIRLNCN